MEYVALCLILVLFIEIHKLHKEVSLLHKQLDTLCKKTGNSQLCTWAISDSDREYILHLKNTGKEVDAVMKVRELTGITLQEAKKYVDTI